MASEREEGPQLNPVGFEIPSGLQYLYPYHVRRWGDQSLFQIVPPNFHQRSGMATRILGILTRSNINTISDMAQIDLESLAAKKGLGRASIPALTRLQEAAQAHLQQESASLVDTAK